MSGIQYYIKCIFKKHETLITIPPLYVYIHRINNRLIFKTKDANKLELQTPGTIKLFGSTKNLIGKTKNREISKSLELVEVVLVDNQYQQKSEVLYFYSS